MAGKHATLTQVKLVVALREVGATKAVIADQTGVSISTVGRICKRFGSCKGRASARLIEDVKSQLMSGLHGNNKLLNATAMHLADDLASTRIIREKIIDAVGRLPLDDPDQIANALRALNSATSALATAQKVGRIATGVDKLDDHDAMPTVLEIRTMTAEETEALRDKQKFGEAALVEADTVVESDMTD